MIIRPLLILSLIAQLAFSFQCGSVTMLQPSLVYPGDLPCIGMGISTSDCSSFQSGSADTAPAQWAPKSCGASPCDQADSTWFEQALVCESGSPCNDDDCPACPPPLTDKKLDGKPILLILPPLLVVVHPTILPSEVARPDTSILAPHRWLTHQTRQARLGTWLH
ncbi:MAG: hypothetical protein O7G85_14100 [Planctomycetota bacterium]|nr:hypothetical protein [Planctomycetota bacterium]